MAQKLIFITHPEVVVDPDRTITDWALSGTGRRRAEAFAENPIMDTVAQIHSSAERKARETSDILSVAKGLPVSVETQLGENDRSATGFLPPTEFEAAADAFFAKPTTSFRGWERAVDAQIRIWRAVHRIVEGHGSGDLAVVSHGAVGTLLWCTLLDQPIDRAHDQPGQGHYWCAKLDTLRPDHGWRPIA